MKSLLASIGLPKAIGLYVGGDAVTLSQVVSTPIGPIEVVRRSEVSQPDELPSVLRRLLAPLTGRTPLRRMPVAIGLPANRTYFATRPIQNPNSDVSPHVLLREALRSPNVPIHEMAVDVIKARPDKRPVASIVSCNRNYLNGLLRALEECGVRPVRVESSPCALLRLAAHRHPARRNSQVVLRLFLGDTQALAALVVDNLPIVWRWLPLRRGDEASTILSAARSLLAVSRDCGIESPLDAVMLHGRSDLPRLLDMDWMGEQMKAPIQWFAGPPLEDSQVALGLALGCVTQGDCAFDLSHSLKPRVSLWELFPWRQAALQAALLLCLALFLADRCRGLNDDCLACQAQNSQYLWMESLSEAQLQQEKSDLTQKVASVRKFLESRVTWTACQRALAACIPDEVFLTCFQGVSEFGADKKKATTAQPKKSLVLRGSAVVSQDGLVPQEIDRFLDVLRAQPTLARNFPVVELADIKQAEAKGDEAPLASFTIVCLPKVRTGTAK
jgi:hypothetical protein